MQKSRIAIVEDEHSLRADLNDYLLSCGFDARAYASAESFYAKFNDDPCDLVLLDIGLPGDSGLQVAQWVRQRSAMGVVILSAFREPVDQVAGLGAGADAYLLKSTSLEVIAATCRSVLRRVAQPFEEPRTAAAETGESAEVSVALWRLWADRWVLAVPGGGQVTLTHAELNFLRLLMQGAGEPVSRPDLLRALGKPDTFSNSRNLENYASRLRRKIFDQCGIELPIKSSYNQGYTFVGPARVEPP